MVQRRPVVTEVEGDHTQRRHTGDDVFWNRRAVRKQVHLSLARAPGVIGCRMPVSGLWLETFAERSEHSGPAATTAPQYFHSLRNQYRLPLGDDTCGDRHD
jgi:hypothetical protein